MLNVGLTQKLSAIAAHLKNWSFVLKMLAANFVFAPLLMIFALYFAPFDPPLKAGLLIFSLGAGAPFLIKLTQTAEHDLALGAAVMMLLMVVTVGYMPVVLPLVLSGVSVDAMAIAKALLIQMLLPIGVGMLLALLLPALVNKIQPWVGRIGNLAMYAMVVATLIGYFPNLLKIIGTERSLSDYYLWPRHSELVTSPAGARITLKTSVAWEPPSGTRLQESSSPFRTSRTRTSSSC
jgi:BASS family bile acid:Na+ symporter